MALKLVRGTNLLLAGLLTGNEIGTKLAVHPALEDLGVAGRIRAEQALTRRFAAIMPYWMVSTVLSCIAALALARGRPGSLPTLLGSCCFAGMLAATVLGNVPINNRTLEIDPEGDQQEFVELRERWDGLHTLRVILTVSGLAFLVAGALSGTENRVRR
jgi:hypothetical protein